MDAAKAMTIMGDPMRQRILDRLNGVELSVGDIARSLPITRPGVSLHLKVLADAGLLAKRRVGRFN